MPVVSETALKKKLLKTDPQIVLLCCLGIAIILAFLWFIDGVSSNQQEVTTNDPEMSVENLESDPVVATIGTRNVFLSQVTQYALQSGKLAADEELSITTALETGLVSDAIDQQLLSQAAVRSGLATQADIRDRLNIARARILSAAYLEKAINEQVTPEAIRSIYDTQKESLKFGEQIRLSAIYVGDVSTAVQLHNALREGVDFREMVQDFSQDTNSRIRNGDIGFYPRNLLPEGFPPELATAKRGFMPLPFETDKGWAIIRVMDQRRMRPPSFQSIEEDIEKFLRARTLNKTLESLRDSENVVYREIRQVKSSEDVRVDTQSVQEEKSNLETEMPVENSPVPNSKPASNTDK